MGTNIHCKKDILQVLRLQKDLLSRTRKKTRLVICTMEVSTVLGGWAIL